MGPGDEDEGDEDEVDSTRPDPDMDDGLSQVAARGCRPMRGRAAVRDLAVTCPAPPLLGSTDESGSG